MNINKKLKITVIVFAFIAFLSIVMLISVILNTKNSLNKMIYNAKVEAENTLLSTGRVIYTEDIEEYMKDNNYNLLSNENLPQNTSENPQEIGTKVALKENWNIETVTAIAVGNGETVPVPIGFYYVGGDLSTGVIISDEEADKYDGQTDKTTWEHTTNLQGNQFVWIPCTEDEYVKSETWNGTTQTPSTLANSGWDKTVYTSELPQIRKYGGFYVARYEAGLAKEITEFTSTQQSTGSNSIYNLEGIPQSRANQVPWMFIDWSHAQTNAKRMYNTNSVSSGLITGTQWDVMLKKFVEKTDLEETDLTNSVNWGNYRDNSIEFKGRMAKAWISSTWNLGAFGGNTEERTTIYSTNNGDLLTTGASKQTEKYHTFDVAGNLWEWTDEASLYKEKSINEGNVQYRIMRGGTYLSPTVSVASNPYYPVSYRHGQFNSEFTYLYVGFRVVLYIK